MVFELVSTALDSRVPILADDRSGLFEALVDYYGDTGAREERRKAAAEWAAFLEGQASAAKAPAARAVFDAHRLLAYLALGEPQRAIPMLEQSARDFPDDYNPPARLARAELELKRYDDALASIDRALALGYGPRKLRLYAVKADILAARRDPVRLAATLKEALGYAKTLPPSEAVVREMGALEKRLAEVNR
jgi:tetratricopeptide (TPR) repeat protein